MTKEQYLDFCLRYKGCGACFPLYEKLSKFEKMWFTAIQKDVADLERENAELKERCNTLDESLVTSTKNNVERQKIIDELKEENAEAKEIIQEMLIYQEGLPSMGELKRKAKQFLKEK